MFVPKADDGGGGGGGLIFVPDGGGFALGVGTFFVGGGGGLMLDGEGSILTFCLGRLVWSPFISLLSFNFLNAFGVPEKSPSLSLLLDGEGGLLPAKMASSSPSVDGLKASIPYVKNSAE